ncbi:MAG TPA: SseB family protein [Jiangellaceae bacterium]|nr:SseB family protein [Jiangellaceae bacterium]
MAAEPRISGEYTADTGAAEPAVTAALSAYDAGTGGREDVIAALTTGRLLVPVVAVLDEAGESDGIRTDKASHLATVTTTGRDGRRGLLAFTCLDSMRRWNPRARPVPVPTRVAAAAALADGADAVVVDLAGPVVFAIEAGDLRTLGSDPQPPEQAAAMRPAPRRGGIVPD